MGLLGREDIKEGGGVGGLGGAPWGGGKGVKLAKIEVLMEVVIKNDENSKC